MSNKGLFVGLGVLTLAAAIGYLYLGKRQVSGVVIPNEVIPNEYNPGTGVPVDNAGNAYDPFKIIKTTVAPLANLWGSKSAIENWTGIPSEQPLTTEALKGAGYQVESYREWLARYPNAVAPMSEAEYYVKEGAYELAARTEPEYAFAAQQARTALSGGKLTPEQYASYEKQHFLSEAGQPLYTTPVETNTLARGDVITYVGGVITDWVNPSGLEAPASSYEFQAP